MYARFLNPTTQRLNWAAYAALVVLCLCFFLPGFFSLPPIDRDEPHFAQASKQMVETGNYIDIRFQEAARYKKPIGIYWMQSASVRLLSGDKLDEIWAYRVPSLVGAVLAVLFTAALGQLFFGPITGLWAALFMAGCLVLNVEARLAKTDAMVLACVTMAQYALANAYKTRGDLTAKPCVGNAVLFWVAQAAGFLIKGPIVLLITCATLLGIKLAAKKTGDITGISQWFKRLYPVRGFLFALLMIVPWFYAITTTSHGAFVQASAGHDLIGKLFQGQDRGMLPPGLHLLALPLVFFPASLPLMLALPDIWKNKWEGRTLFLLSWIALPWVLFELALTKLPHYVMPLYPALAILAAEAVHQGFPWLKTNYARVWPKIAASVWITVAAGLAIGALFLSYKITGRVPYYMPVVAFIFVSLMGWGLIGLAQGGSRRLWPFVAGPLLFYGICFGFLLPGLDDLWLSQRIISTARQAQQCQAFVLAADAFTEPSLVFLGGTHTRFINDGTVLAHEMQTTPCMFGLVSAKHKSTFLAAWATPPNELLHLNSYNLGSGRTVDITLYAAGRLEP